MDIILYFIAVIIILFLMIVFINWCQEEKCPKCGSKVVATFYDKQIDKIVWECENCGERYIIS